MKIAIIGTGIAGNVAAYQLSRRHDITVFEAENRIGGHTNTVDIVAAGRKWAVDTGFIVFNDQTYPNFISLLGELGVESQPSQMGFSVRNESSGLEYSGSSISSLFAQRSNLLRPSFYRMLNDILRFNREAPALMDEPGNTVSLGEYLERNGYSRGFMDHYIIPMGAAIWSATPGGMRAIPALFFIRFFQNHGLLSVNERPTWRVIKGGSRTYVDRLVAGHRDRIRLNAPVDWVRRGPGMIAVKPRDSEVEFFDRVFMACHSDQALRLLADPTDAERETLGAIQYQQNEAVLHTDESLMPRRRRAWAAWNYHIPKSPTDTDGKVALTYNMNILQGLDAPMQFCVTLNKTHSIDPGRVIRSFTYAHPVFTERAVAAQKRQREINGARGTYYCGAYWRNGFHEDGVVSALAALDHFRGDQSDMENDVDEKRYLRRAS